jgi:hypothetical protein
MSNQAMGMTCAKYLKTTQNGADAARQTMPDDAQRRKKTDRMKISIFSWAASGCAGACDDA